MFKKTATGAGLAFILVTVFMDVLSLGLIIPITAKLVKELAGNSDIEAAKYVGLFATVWALMQFFSSPIMGALSDRFGRRPVLLLSAFGLGIDYLLLAFAPNLTWLFIGRIFSGIFAASFSTASAYIADVTPPDKRSIAYGLYGATFGLGFILGPAIGGTLGDYNLRWPFLFSAALTLANACYGFFVLPESLPPEIRKPFRWTRANPLGSLELLRSVPGLLPMAISLWTYQLAHSVFSSVFVLYTDSRFGWKPGDVGRALAMVGILNFIVQGALVRRLMGTLGERNMVFMGLIGGILGFTAYGFVEDGNSFFASTVIFCLMGFFSAAIQGLMTKKMDPSMQGQLSGANSALNGIAGMVGPALFTTVFRFTIDPHGKVYMPGAPFFLAALILALGLVCAFIAIPKGTDAPLESPPTS